MTQKGKPKAHGKVCPLLSVAQAAYIAGSVDADGMIGVSRQKVKEGRSFNFRLLLNVSNTKVQLLNWLKETTGVGCVVSGQPPGSEMSKQSYRWDTWSNHGLSVLVQIRPFLVIKGKQADIAIRFQTAKKERKSTGCKQMSEQDYTFEQACWADLKVLNHRGIRLSDQEPDDMEMWNRQKEETRDYSRGIYG